MKIITIGNEVLREKSEPVKTVDVRIRRLLGNMAKLMYEADGVGLAAPQVGISERIIVLDAGDGLIEMINPEITTREGCLVGSEGCLSIPGKSGDVSRATRIRVCGLDRTGKPLVIEAQDFLARVFQHEIDHLDGVLFIDRAIAIHDIPLEEEDT